ncbi:MAG TPA: hypothetical protein VFI48_08155 [Hyphomicrobiaceae bacterium]|nr:hypothetical protein [Hyphomicrobiaceae bacterium]
MAMRLDWLAYAGIGLKGQAREHAAQEVLVFADEQRVVDANDADSDFGDATGQADPALSDAINALPRVMPCSASTPSPSIVDALLANCIFKLPWASLGKAAARLHR